MAQHTVRQGDCISSIAERHGLFWETVWQHPNNAGLRERRGDPNVILPGDVVFVPERRIAEYRRPTGATHTFQRKGVPAQLRLQFLEGDQPRANEAFTITVDGVETRGQTDGDGVLQVSIRPTAMRATVRFDSDGEEVDLQLGMLDPVESMTGVKARLLNLGFDVPSVSDGLDDATREALREFQQRVGLPVTGEADDATRARLAELHDRPEAMPPRPEAPEEDDD